MAFTNYYANTSTSGAADGTTQSDELSLSTMVTQINGLGAGGGSGRHYYVRGSHTGRGASDTLTVGGTNQSPLWISGYVATPGDLDYVQYDAYGRILTTGMIPIGYNSGNLRLTTYQYTVLNGFLHSNNYNGDGYRVGSGGGSVVYNCAFSNANTGSSADALYIGSGGNRIINCSVASPASGGFCAAHVATGVNHFIGCQIVAPGAAGIYINGSSTTTVVNTIISGSVTGVSAQHATAVINLFNTTIYGCSGDGVDIISTNTQGHTLCGTHITDCGGWAVDGNGGTSGGYVMFSNCRFRDNTSGNVNGYADWTTATSFAHVTTDTGGASTDFVDVGNLDFRLISAAPGRRTGLGYYANIGACGDNVSGGGTLAAAYVGT